MTPGWSLAIGALGAPWCYQPVRAVNRINLVDDTLDAFGLHGSGGFAGAILTGIFAVDEGLIYSGSFVLLGKQIAAALAGVAFSAVGTAIIVGVMKMLFKLRIPEDQELAVLTSTLTVTATTAQLRSIPLVAARLSRKHQRSPKASAEYAEHLQLAACIQNSAANVSYLLRNLLHCAGEWTHLCDRSDECFCFRAFWLDTVRKAPAKGQLISESPTSWP